MKKLKLNVHILYPGGFKPIHEGHMFLIENAIKSVKATFGPSNVDPKVHIILSNKSRDGVTAETTARYLDSIGIGKYGIDYIICDGSPVRKAYNIVATKEYGNGYYYILSSKKDSDIDRCMDFVDAFKIGGKYYTEGATVMYCPPSAPMKYAWRNDDKNGEIISSRIVRQDAINSDYENFEKAYLHPYFSDKTLLGRYYIWIKRDMENSGLFEGAAAGHINHPYEEDYLTFAEISDMIRDVFSGSIEDMTEKIDGMNIMASVDTRGRAIFARNKSQLTDYPMTLDDIRSNKQSWSKGILASFVKGAETIAAIFKNIKDAKSVFNEDDKLDGVRYRTWCNFEITDTASQNVIPYTENIISLNGFITACLNYGIDKEGEWEIFEPHESNVNRIKPVVIDAMKKTNETYFKVKLPQNVFLAQAEAEREVILRKYQEMLEELCEDYNLTMDSNIRMFKRESLKRYLVNNGFSDFSDEEIDRMAEMVLGQIRLSIMAFPENERKRIVDFRKNKEKDVLKRIMLPIDKFFIDFGNDVIKCCKGIQNEGNEKEIVAKIKKGVVDAIDSITKSNDERKIDKLEYLLIRLGNDPEIYPSEGIVYTYKGRKYKLTGSFAALNQIKNLLK